MLEEEKLDVVRPETVRVPAELERPEPSKLLKEELLIMRFVVEAVAKEE